MKTNVLSDSDKKWQAESDADALRRYAEIASDKTRIAAASKVLSKQANDVNNALGVIKTPSKVAKSATPKKATPNKVIATNKTKKVNNIKAAMMSNGKW